MKVLLAHNRYVHRGGEDAVFDQEGALLRSHGHEVVEYLRDNRDLKQGDARMALDTVWSSSSRKEAERVMRELKPDILHVHNTLPQISPSIYYAAAACKVPVVQTLHNYRLLCANGMLMRDGGVCEDCVGRKVRLPGHRAPLLPRRPAGVVLGGVDRRPAPCHAGRGATRSRAISRCASSREPRCWRPASDPSGVVVKPNFSRDRHAGVDLDAPSLRCAVPGQAERREGGGRADRRLATLDVPINVIGTGPLEADMRSGRVPRSRSMGS